MSQNENNHLRLLRTAERPDEASDEELMLLTASGEQRAFARLVGRHEVSVRRFCHGMLGDEQSARDAAQEAFLRLWRARERYRADDRFRQFLFTIVRNHCRSLLRRRAVRRLMLPSPDPAAAEPTDEPSAEQQLADQDTTRLVRRALARLPEKQRTPLLLRFVEEMSYDEMATVLGRNPSTVRSRVHHGLRALARYLPPEVNPWQS